MALVYWQCLNCGYPNEQEEEFSSCSVCGSDND